MPGGWGAFTNLKLAGRVFVKVNENIKKEAARANYNLAARILKQAKRNAPVGESGNLRRSGRLEPPTVPKYGEPLFVAFGGEGSLAPYSIYVEVGTSFQEGQFFLLRAVKQFAPNLLRDNKNAVIKAWNTPVIEFNMKNLT